MIFCSHLVARRQTEVLAAPLPLHPGRVSPVHIPSESDVEGDDLGKHRPVEWIVSSLSPQWAETGQPPTVLATAITYHRQTQAFGTSMTRTIAAIRKRQGHITGILFLSRSCWCQPPGHTDLETLSPQLETPRDASRRRCICWQDTLLLESSSHFPHLP